MTFQVYPDPPSPPIAAGFTCPLTKITELSSGVPGATTMFIRVVEIGGSCAPPGGADPTIILKADMGAEVPVPKPQTGPILNENGVEVADAIMNVEAGNVYRVRVFISDPVTTWQLRITNNDSAAHDYVWVVASTDAEASQPLPSLPPALSFDVLVKQSATLPLTAANNGTGVLSFSDTPGTSLGSGFVLTAVPPPIDPNECGDFQVTFTGPASPGASTVTHAFPSNEQNPQAGGTHNSQVTFTATTRPPASGG
jgi:hypothetical protein